MNAYLRNGVITLVINVVIFIIGWGCIVPDQMMDNTHLFGIIGNVEIVKGNTATVFGMCALLSTLSLIVGMVEAIIEDYRPRCPTTRAEKRTKLPTGTFAGNKMRITDPSPAKVDGDPKTSEKCEKIDEDPKTPTMD